MRADRAPRPCFTQAIPSSGALRRVVLSGTCVKAGDLVYQFINKAAAAGNVTTVKITQSTTVTNATDNFDGC